MGYRGANRHSAGFIMEARQRVIKLYQRRWKILSSEFPGSAVIEQVLPVQLINLLVGETAQRRAQDADERQPIVGIFYCAQQVDGVDDFFRGVKVALTFDDVTNFLAAQGF